MQLEFNSLLEFVVEVVAISAFCTFVGEFGKIVGFKLYAVEFVVAAEFLYLGFGLFG